MRSRSTQRWRDVTTSTARVLRPTIQEMGIRLQSDLGLRQNELPFSGAKQLDLLIGNSIF